MTAVAAVVATSAPGRSVPPDPADVPPRPPAVPRRRSPTRSPGSRPTSTSGRAATSSREISATAAIARYRRPGPARPRRRRCRRPAVAPGTPGTAARRVAPIERTGGRPSRPGRDPGRRGRPALLAVRVRRVPASRGLASWPTALGGPLTPDEAGDVAADDAGRPDPRRRGAVRGRRDEPRRAPDPRPGRPAGRDPSRRSRDEVDRVARRAPTGVGVDEPTRSGRPSTAARGRSGPSPIARSSPLTWTASCAPAVGPAAPRTSSAGTSSSAATASTCASCRPSGPGPDTWPGPPSAVALVTPDPRAPTSPLSVMFDLGLAAENMMLAAWELGIGSVPATVYEHDLARRLLGLPGRPPLRVPAVVRLSRPTRPTSPGRQKAGGRRPLDDHRPRGALVGARGAPADATASGTSARAIPKHTTSQPSEDRGADPQRGERARRRPSPGAARRPDRSAG